MDQCLIDSHSHDPKNSYHRRKGHIISCQRKDDNSSSNGKENTRNNNNSIFNIVELNNQNKNHKNKSDKHSLT